MDAGDLAALITAGVGVLGAIGGTARFVWNKVEARFDKIEVALARCEERDRQHLERRGVQLTVIEMMWRELERLDPGSHVLGRVKRLLDGLKVQLGQQQREVKQRDELP